jgi:hypothetical protein
MMSMLDGILRNIGGASDDVANLAEKIGIDPAMAERAIATLGQTHQMQGDTVELASARTGLAQASSRKSCSTSVEKVHLANLPMPSRTIRPA